VLRECIYPQSYIVYIQTETLNFTFAQKAILHIYIFVPTAWLLLLWQHNVIAAPRVTACCCDEAKTSEMVLHLCTCLLNPHFNLEPDYIIRKPMKHRFQRYIVHTEIYSTLHTSQIHFSVNNTLLKTGLSVHRHTDRHTKVYPPVSLHSLGGYNNCISLNLCYSQWTVKILRMRTV